MPGPAAQHTAAIGRMQNNVQRSAGGLQSSGVGTISHRGRTAMTRRLCFAIALAAHCAIAASGLRGQDLASRIATVVEAPDYRHGRWGLLVVEADSGRVVYERNADQLFAPASTTKLYSCSSALHDLGPDYRFETPVYRRGAVEDGHLRGDLILVASGDLTLGGRTLPDGTL